jgi:hypothetical protein
MGRWLPKIPIWSEQILWSTMMLILMMTKYCWRVQLNVMRWGKKYVQNCSRKHWRERPFGMYWRRCGDKIKTNLEYVAYDSVEWIQPAQDRTQMRIWQRTFWLHKRQGICWPAQQLSVSQEGLYSTVLVSGLSLRIESSSLIRSIFSAYCVLRIVQQLLRHRSNMGSLYI